MADNNVRLGQQRQEQRLPQRQKKFNALSRFDLDESKKPPGYTYEWKVLKVAGMEWTEAIVQAELNGWEPVPSGRHPELVGQRRAKEEASAPIIRGDQMLMQIPTEWYQQMLALDRHAAMDPLESQIARLGLEARHLGGRRGGVRRERSPVTVAANDDVVEG